MQRFFVLVGHFAFACLVTFVLSSMVHSQFVLQGLVDIGITVSLQDRLNMTIDDLQGLFATLGAIISLSLLFGFATVAAVSKFTKTAQYNTYLYPLAGSVAIWVMLAAMHPIMNITVLASARSTAGLVSLCICGAIGGIIFSKIRVQQGIRLT
jgi:hypothetical protein